jgi:D-3-phosphoglycerate dehydrogenase
MSDVIKNILIAGKVHQDGLSILDKRDDILYQMIEFPTAEDFIEKLPHCDGLLLRTMPLPAAALTLSHKLKVISRHGVGYDNVPMAVANDMRIPVTIIDNVNAIAVAEYTLMMMLALAKQCLQYDYAVRTDNWAIQNTLAATELWNKNVLLIGFGRIGFEVSKRLKAFDSNVYVYDPYLEPHQFSEYGVTQVTSLPDALVSADYVSLHLPLTPETKNIIDAQALQLMKPSAFLINAARGGLVDEDALAQALTHGQIKGAGLDTLAKEPLPNNSPLASLSNLLLSPHSAGLTNECAARMGISSAKNILAVFDKTISQQLIVNRNSI